MLDSLSSDMVDGYIDEPANYPFLLAIKPRTSVTETVAIDQAKLQQQLSGAHLAMPGTLKVVSFANEGESQVDNGQSMVSHENYLSGYAAVAEYPTGDPEAPVSVEILYYGFNLGKWKGQLNAETTTLYQVFLQQPELIFLPPSEQQRIAENMANADEFKQAVELYEAELLFSEEADPTLRSILIATLAEEALAQISSQVPGTRGVLQTRILAAQQENGQRSSVRSAEVNKVELPANGQQMFTIFDGMRVLPRVIDEVNVLEFYSNSALWYALYDNQKYHNIPEKPEEPIQWYHHALDPSLITPKAGWIDFQTVGDSLSGASLDSNAMRTRMPVANVDINLTDSSKKAADLVIFRNNPDSYVDAPQLMNTMTLVSVSLKALTGFGVVESLVKGYEKLSGGANFIAKGLKGFEKAIDAIKNVKPYFDVYWEMAKFSCEFWGKAAERLQDIDPSLAEQVKGKVDLEVTDCNQRFGQLETFKKAVDELWPDVVPTANYNGSEDEKLEFQKVIAFRDVFRHPSTRSLNLLKRFLVPPPALLKIFLVEKTLVERLVVPGLDYYSSQKSQKISYQGNEVTNTDIAKAMAYELGWVNRPSTEKMTIDKQQFIARQAFKAAGKMLLLSNKKDDIMLALFKTTEKFVKFLHDIRNLSKSVPNFNSDDKWNWIVVMGTVLLQAGQEYLKENSAQLIEKMLTEAVLSFTPAKVVQLASAANQGSAIAWDWMTKPSAVHIKIKRLDTEGSMQFSQVVDLSLVSYVAVDINRDKSVLDYSATSGKEVSNVSTDQQIYPVVGGEKNANDFLVMSGFVGSVENFAVFSGTDKDTKNTLDNLIDSGNVRVDWHSYRYHSLPDMEQSPLSNERNASNSFTYKKDDKGEQVTNFWEVTLNNDFWKFWNRNTFFQKYSESSANNWMLTQFIKNNPGKVEDGNVNYLDFSQIYGDAHNKIFGLNDKSKNLLTHVTPGVYRDTTEFELKGVEGGSEYDNTFNMYVLPNYLAPLRNDLSPAVQVRNLNDALKRWSRRDGALLQLKVNISSCYANNTYWGDISMVDSAGSRCTALPEDPNNKGKPYPGLKDSPFYVMVKYRLGGRDNWIRPNKEGMYLGADSALLSYRLFSFKAVESVRIYVYDAILEAWRRQTGKSLIPIFEKYLGGVCCDSQNQPFQPFMSFSLDELQQQDISAMVLHTADHGTGRELPGVEVTIKREDGSIFMSGETDADAEFDIANLPYGQYTIVLYKPGYEEISQSMTIDAETPMPLVFDLKPDKPTVVDLPEKPQVVVAPGQNQAILTFTIPDKISVGADIAFVVDQSSSYNDDIGNFKAKASEMVTAFDQFGKSVQYALVGFSDYPTGSYGYSEDFSYRLYQGLTNEKGNFINALGGLSIYKGKDGPESQLEAVYRTVQELAWRMGSLKIVFLATDNSFHNSDNESSYPGHGYSETLSALKDRNITVYGLAAGGEVSDLTKLAEATGGLSYPLSVDSKEVVNKISSALVDLQTTGYLTVEPDPQNQQYVESISPPKIDIAGMPAGSPIQFTVTFKRVPLSETGNQEVGFSLFLKTDKEAFLERQ
ncbi:MAG: hypothetical protein BWK78_05335, partial [Thiotrichaceae bacterium IS1]